VGTALGSCDGKVDPLGARVGLSVGEAVGFDVGALGTLDGLRLGS